MILKNYKKANLFWDTYTFVPISVISLILLCWIITNEFKKEFLIIFMLFIPTLIYGYVRSIIKVKKYNQFLNNSIVVEGYVVDIKFVEAKQYGRAKVIVKYKYTDSLGIYYHKEEEVFMFQWETPYSRQILKWKKLYYSDKKIMVLVKENDYSISYLPLREDYCKEYKKTMSVDFSRFN